MRKFLSFLVLFLLGAWSIQAQKNIVQANDASAPLHALQPDYPIPYQVPLMDSVKKSIEKVFKYLVNATPAGLVDANGNPWNPSQTYSSQLVFGKGDFRPISYEFGVVYSGMLEWYRLTKDPSYFKFVEDRLNFISQALPKAQIFDQGKNNHILRGLVRPKALDDIGAMAMAMIKAKEMGYQGDLSIVLENAERFILKEEHRLGDGTLVRIRPLKNTLWLDDLYMALPALVQMGNYQKNYEFHQEAFFQFDSYFKRLYNKEKNLYMHGYLEGANFHPEFHWGRANGWALLTVCEMLEFLPESNPNKPVLLERLKIHLKGILARQAGSGFWHQLLDREDSYLETSASAIYTYVLAKGINKGWLDPQVYAPAALLGWNAIATKVNPQGQVEGTCVGTGLAWDPVFYYNRPISPYAAHAYGPFLLAGSAIYELIQNKDFIINDSAIHLKEP